MALIIANCPRCNAEKITFNIKGALEQRNEYGDFHYEVFCECRSCFKSTVFVIEKINSIGYSQFLDNAIFKTDGAINDKIEIKGFISLKDNSKIKPPEYLPSDIEAIFNEGATCLTVACPNAAGTMFRLCIDKATEKLLPETDENGLTAHIRRTLALRLKWLFEHNILSKSLEGLSSCIREDGNDGAHQGTLTLLEAEDLIDFTTILLERLYTEPKRIELAADRRAERRK